MNKFEIENLKTLECGTSFYPEESQQVRNAEIELDGDRLHCQKSEKRVMLDALKISNAAKHLQRLPDQDETFHVIMKGNYDGFDLVNAVLSLSDSTITRLDIATLGFNKRNAHELIRLLDTGEIKATTFLCSVYYRANEPEVFDWLYNQLKDRDCPMVACRCHCKIMLFEMEDQHYVIESSANLRSCKMIEQFTLTNSQDVLYFHRSWMNEMIEKGGEK